MDSSERLRIEQIHTWIARAARLSFVPIPISGRDGRTVQEEAGALWDLSPWMSGKADLSEPSSPVHKDSAFVALAEFHKEMNEITPKSISPGLVSRLAEIELLLSRDLDDWRKIVSKFPVDQSQRLGMQWLGLVERPALALLPEIRNAAAKTIAVQPVLRDARPEHFLFTNDRVAGLVDFGAMGVDAVSVDLARLLSEWLPYNDKASRTEAIAAYERIRPLSDTEREQIEAFEKSANLLGGARWIRWHFVDRVAFADQTAIFRGLSQSVNRINRLMTIRPALE